MAIVFVRTGIFGEIGLFELGQLVSVSPHQEVICRTDRGLEVGTVVGARSEEMCKPSIRGRVLRPVNAQDRLVIERLGRYKTAAVADCEKLLANRGVDAVLVDAEHLFDGQALYFYFAGQIDSSVDEILQMLAETYDQRVGFSRLAAKLAEGCGVNCGIASDPQGSAGCGRQCASCAGCSSKVH